MATEVHPELLPIGPGHDVRCWVYHDAAGNLMPDAPADIQVGAAAATGAGSAEGDA